MWPLGSAKFPALARFQGSDHLKGLEQQKEEDCSGTTIEKKKKEEEGNDDLKGLVGGQGRGESTTRQGGGGQVDDKGEGGGGYKVSPKREVSSFFSSFFFPSSSPLPSPSAHAERVRDLVQAAVGVRKNKKGRLPSPKIVFIIIRFPFSSSYVGLVFDVAMLSSVGSVLMLLFLAG